LAQATAHRSCSQALFAVGVPNLSILVGGVVSRMVRDETHRATVGFLLLIYASTAMEAHRKQTPVEIEWTPVATIQLESASAGRHAVATEGDGTVDVKTVSAVHSVPFKALVLCIASGLSLPIGAFLGILTSPVKDSTCAGMMAFGAGALLFAVTVELYGEALRELEETKGEHKEELFFIIIGAAFGGLLYLYINRWLQQVIVGGAAPETDVFARGVSQVSGVQSTTSIIECVTALEQTEAPDVRDEVVLRAQQVALALFFGLLVDGVPEGILMGFLAAEDHLSMVFVVSLFVANFPEAFSSSSLLRQARYGTPAIIGMWTALCLFVGVLGSLSSWAILAFYPDYGKGFRLPLLVRMGIALVEGTAGGAMIACIASVMLPEAFERAGTNGSLLMSSGFMCLCGFLLAVALKVWEVA